MAVTSPSSTENNLNILRPSAFSPISSNINNNESVKAYSGIDFSGYILLQFLNIYHYLKINHQFKKR